MKSEIAIWKSIVKEQKRNAFLFTEDIGKVCDILSDKDAALLIRAMFDYAFQDIEPDFSGNKILEVVWIVIEPNLVIIKAGDGKQREGDL